MDVPKLAIPCFEGPFLMRVQVSKPNVVNNYVLD